MLDLREQTEPEGNGKSVVPVAIVVIVCETGRGPRSRITSKTLMVDDLLSDFHIVYKFECRMNVVYKFLCTNV